MWLLITNFFSLRPGKLGGVVYVFAGLGVLLLLLDAMQHYNNHKEEKIRLRVERNRLLDSVARADEANTQYLRSLQDSILTGRYQRQSDAAALQQKRDEDIEKRYRAGRVALPAL